MHITNDAILLTYVENEMVLGKFKFHAFKCNIACNKRKQGAAYAHKKHTIVMLRNLPTDSIHVLHQNWITNVFLISVNETHMHILVIIWYYTFINVFFFPKKKKKKINYKLCKSLNKKFEIISKYRIFKS